MKSFKIDNITEIFFINENFVFIIRSYSFDLNFLYMLSFPGLTLIRQGTYAYCYDYVCTINSELNTNSVNEV